MTGLPLAAPLLPAGPAAPAVTAAVAGLLVLGYYGRVLRLVGEPLARRVLTVLVDASPLGRRRSLADLDGVVRLLLAGAMQAGFVLLLVAALPVRFADLAPDQWDGRLLLLGVPLGIAEAGLGTYVAYLGSRIAQQLHPGRTPTTVEGWLTVARGGWIRYYLRTAAAFPTWLLVAATLLYVSGEEVVFRGVLLTSAAHLPAPVAVILSTALFATAQVFYTPGWRTALFPVLGATVLGLVHGILYLAVPDLTPLIIAHATMFLVTVR
jgi:membrane protease YdiL (CAAX protease family)